MQELWNSVDRRLEELLIRPEESLSVALESNRADGLPSIDVSPLFGKFLGLLIGISGACRVLEIGTLGGYSTAWMARALPEDGHVVTLELNPHHAEVARANLASAGVLGRVEIRVGPAVESLRELQQEGADSFDFIFIDADKKSMPIYLDWSLKLAHKGTILVADNVVREGKVLDADSTDEDVRGTRRFLELAGSNPRLHVTALQTVGVKEYDGFAVAVVLS
ncbi:MAG TPA: O-methyltransferase [Terracidiphilus sp.]